MAVSDLIIRKSVEVYQKLNNLTLESSTGAALRTAPINWTLPQNNKAQSTSSIDLFINQGWVLDKIKVDGGITPDFTTTGTVSSNIRNFTNLQDLLVSKGVVNNGARIAKQNDVTPEVYDFLLTPTSNNSTAYSNSASIRTIVVSYDGGTVTDALYEAVKNADQTSAESYTCIIRANGEFGTDYFVSVPVDVNRVYKYTNKTMQLEYKLNEHTTDPLVVDENKILTINVIDETLLVEE